MNAPLAIGRVSGGSNFHGKSGEFSVPLASLCLRNHFHPFSIWGFLPGEPAMCAIDGFVLELGTPADSASQAWNEGRGKVRFKSYSKGMHV
jgi:hypothetical protein